MRSLLRIPLSVGLLILAAGLGLAQGKDLARTINLNRVEKKTLNSSLSPAVRNFLETADRFEIFAQLEVRDGTLQPAMDRELNPNFKAEVTSSETRTRLLKALYSEASKGEPPAICYNPSHSIVAHKGNQKVTVEICFGCNRFYVSGPRGKSHGTFSRASGETERLISELIADLGVTTK